MPDNATKDLFAGKDMSFIGDWTFENNEADDYASWRIFDEATVNSETVAVVYKTGEGAYDDKVVYLRVRLLAAAGKLFNACYLALNYLKGDTEPRPFEATVRQQLQEALLAAGPLTKASAVTVPLLPRVGEYVEFVGTVLYADRRTRNDGVDLSMIIVVDGNNTDGLRYSAISGAMYEVSVSNERGTKYNLIPTPNDEAKRFRTLREASEYASA